MALKTTVVDKYILCCFRFIFAIIIENAVMPLFVPNEGSVLATLHALACFSGRCLIIIKIIEIVCFGLTFLWINAWLYWKVCYEMKPLQQSHIKKAFKNRHMEKPTTAFISKY